MDGLRDAIARRIRAGFSDPSGEPLRISRDDPGYYAADSIIRRVHGDVTTMMIGGIAALLMQMLHPRVLAGVWDHSRFREDMAGRLRRTSAFIARTTYGDRAEADAAVARVRAIHARIGGSLPDGTPYRADEPRLLAWVHVTEATAFLDSFIRYREPFLSRNARDRYFAEIGVIGRLLGADAVPVSDAEARRLILAIRPELQADARSREVARLILAPPKGDPALGPVHFIATQAGIDLLPRWARRMHGLDQPLASRPLLRGSAHAMAAISRWAMQPRPNASRG